MRILVLILCTIIVSGLSAQDKKSFALLLNVAQMPYQCLELNGVISSQERQFQLLAALNYTSAVLNDNQRKNLQGFDPEYMEKASDKISGMGYGLQFRFKLSGWNKDKWLLMGSLGCRYYDYNVQFYENEYIEDQPPFYHFKLVEHNEKLNRIAPDAQIVINFAPKMFFMDFGVGFAYNKSYIPESLEAYRNYHESLIDYGYTGFSPVVSIRFGAWIF